jgi:hypothetical protein
MSVYQVLTENGQSDAIAKKNATNLAKSGKTLEEIKQEYPNKVDAEDIKNVKDGVVKLKTKFDESNNKLSALNTVLNKKDVSGKDIEVALKSFVSAIDNTAAMAGEVSQARDAGVSAIQQWQDYVAKRKDGTVSDKTKKDISNTITNFHDGIKTAYDSYIGTQQQLLKENYGDFQANKLNVYKRPEEKKLQTTTEFKE